VDEVDHRPWPMPNRPWLMTQTWNDLLFAHWPIAADRMRALVPRAFDLDLFDGTAWVGVVPFYMTNVGARGLPLFPGVSAFPELNVRTYVRAGDRPGVYFFSLDASSKAAVRAARLLLNLPYFAASMTVESSGSQCVYRSIRREDPAAEFEATYEPSGPVFLPRAGTLEYFLIERYCLYNSDRSGTPYRLDIHHPPWRVHVARANLTRNSMTTACGLPLPDLPPLLHFSKRQDTVAWGKEPLK
jgi:uncharacterized protein YqjF (DUF2071 family)